MKILLLDNYDSFTFNLLHILEQYEGAEVCVCRNDKISLAEVDKYDSIIISPGPGLPEDAGILLDLLDEYKTIKKILGVCLGHQALGIAFGNKLKNLETVYHGIAMETQVIDNTDPLFRNIPKKFVAGRYHSWVIDPENLSEELKVTAIDSESNVMAIKHMTLPLWGIQFHPESILTEYGKELIFNWIEA